MHASAILERCRVVSPPGADLLLLGGDALLFEQFLANAFNASWVVADRSLFLNRGFSRRVFSGRWNQIPFDSQRFGTVVVSSSWFYGLDADEVTRALSEVARVCGGVLLVIAGASGADPESARRWWESQLLEWGWRRHTRFFGVLEFETLEDEIELCLVMERLSASALAAHPLDALRAERDLHMDMLRETGRRSDAHLARYEWARGWIKPGDVVVDAACGLGYGSAILWDGAEAASVTGLDISEPAIGYATDCFCDGRPGLAYRVANVESWEGFADHSVDCIVSFETIEHLARPDLFVQGAKRVLKPGGRFLCSIPNEWLDDTGRDPNPFHLHVFNLDRLVDLVGASLLVDEAYAQSAGGHAARFSPRRMLRNVGWPETNQQIAREAEWWLLSAVKDPIATGDVPYKESVFAGAVETPNAIAFARDYVNPWAVQALVIGCHRVRAPRLLRELAARWLATSPEDSADAGAALCILAYRGLEAGRDLDSLLLARIAEYRRIDSQNPHVRRWQVSLAFAEGLWRMKSGDSAAAEEILRWCAANDASAFTPHLETKTTEAAWLAGRLALERGDTERAKADWQLAFAALERLRALPVDEWLIVPERPNAFEIGDGLREIAAAVDSAALSANALRALQDSSGAYRQGGRDIDRNFQRNATRLVTEIHSRGGYILQLRDQVAELQRSSAAAHQELERVTLAAKAIDDELAAARLEASAASERARRNQDDRDALASELRIARNAADTASDASAALQHRIAGLQKESAALFNHLQSEQCRTAALEELLADERNNRFRTDAERAALRGALRRLMPRVLILGAGDDGRRVWEALTQRGTVDVVGFVDSDRHLHDRPFLGTTIRSADALDQRNFDAIAVAGTPSRELRDRLRRLQIPPDSIISFPTDRDDAALERVAADWFPDPLAAALVERPQPSGLRLGIFGTGSGAMKVWEALAEIDSASAVWFADNNERQQGQHILWLDVIAPSAIRSTAYDAIVIGSMSVDPIRRQLLALGVSAQCLLTPNVTGSIAAIREELLTSIATLAEVSPK